MSSPGTLTGRNGKFVVDDTLVARTTQWNVSRTLATKSEWGDSDSAGYTNRAAGRKDATFTAEGKFETTDEVWDLFQPEDVCAAVLWMDNVSLYWDYPSCLCMDFGMAINIDTEEIVSWNSSWGADGIFYTPGQAGAPVRTLPT
jgi:hypothetical protein